MKKKLVYQSAFGTTNDTVKSPRNPKSRCYIIHLKVEYYEPQKKEKKADVEIAHQNLIKNAKNAFAVAVKTIAEAKEVSLLKEEYTGPTMSTAVLIEVNREKQWDILDQLRALDIVEMMEPEFHEPEV